MSVSHTLLARSARAFVEAAERLVVSLAPATWTPAVRRAAARRLWRDAVQALPRFALLAGLLSLAIVHIVVITTQNYGLSQFALSTVIRLLLVELLPLLAAIHVALMPAAPVHAVDASGADDDALAEGAARAAPHVASRAILVAALIVVGSAIALGIAYLGVFGLTAWGATNFTHTVGRVFDPVVLSALLLKLVLYSLSVATLDSTALIFGVLIGIETLLLLVEFL